VRCRGAAGIGEGKGVVIELHASVDAP
jgi:hypothetical protein